MIKNLNPLNKTSGISIFSGEVSPFKQVIFVVAVGVVLMGLTELLPQSPRMERTNSMPWTVASAMLLFFALANSVLAFSVKDGNKYWLYSMMSYAVLFITVSSLAYLVSGVGMDEAGSFRWIFLVFTFGYLILLSIVNLIRFFVALSKRSDEIKKQNEGVP